MTHRRMEREGLADHLFGRFVPLLSSLLAAACLVGSATAAPPETVEQPAFRVDVSWPQPLPNKWLLGDVGGVSVDRHNHIWVVHRPSTIRTVDVLAGANPPKAKCCVAAPPVLEFDTDGKLLRSWGGAQIEDWFDSPHSVFVDAEDNVWILGAGNRDGQLMKLTPDGKLLLRIGRKGAFVAADDPTMLARPTDIYVDTKRREVFVSDGYRNHRVIVFNSETGAFKRQWTAFGKKVDGKYFTDRDEGEPGMPAGNTETFSTVHCVTMIGEELFVCDRVNDRIQVFKPNGTFIREFFFNRRIAGSSGSTWDAAPVPGRPDLILVVDGTNSEIALLDKNTGNVVSSYLSKGRYAGQMTWPHQVAIDREGRLYVAEVGGAARIQRFTPNAATR